MAKPASHLDWTDGVPAKAVEPSAAKKLTGWVALERPPFEFMNWLFFRQDEWNKYFETETDGLLALQSTFDVVIGVGGTHATLEDAIADGGLGDDLSVLVKDPRTVTAPITLSKAGWKITFKARATYSQGLSTSPALILTANRIQLIGGRFTDFDGGSDIAIQVQNTAENCKIDGTYFANVDQDVDDQASNTTIVNTVTEV